MPVTQSWTLQNKEFFFDPVWHTYKLNGRIIPSVTKIIRTVTAQGLSHIPPKNLQKAADRGTAIHKEIETGVISSIEANWIEKQINRNNCVFEKMFYCEYDNFTFAGTADIIGIDTVYDIKTQNEPDVFMWMLQLNLYNLFFKKEYLKILHTPKSGNYKVFDIPHLTENQIKQIIFAYQNNQTIGDDFMKDLKVIEDVRDVEPIKLELEIYKQNIGELTTNAEKLKEQVEKQLQLYKAENYSPDTIDNAKKDKAELNKAAKMLNDKRIEIERQFMKPIDDFKNTINETVALIKTASGEIDLIVKAVENKEKEAKKAIIVEYFNSLNFELIGIDKIFNDKWLNKTAKIEDTKKEILEKIEKIKSDLNVLERIGETEARDFYLSTLNLDTALAKADEIKANREHLAKLEAEKAKVEEKKESDYEELSRLCSGDIANVNEVEACKIYNELNGDMEATLNELVRLNEEREKPQVVEKEDTASETITSTASEKIYTVDFTAMGTEAQLKELQSFMDKIDIKYQFKK